MRRSALLFLSILAASPIAASAADDITIYRCTDASGRLTLRDTPCRKDQQQQTRMMVRPKDAPAVLAPPAPLTAREAAPPLPPRVVVMTAPRPLYECIPPDGAPYTSDSAEGNPRWVPLWTLGYPGTGFRFSNGMGTTGVSVTHGGPPTDGRGYPGRRWRGYGPAVYGAGTWIRDECHALPPAEVCSRLVDRRDAIRTRFFNAMPSERDTLRVEERGINARLGNDCGIR
jgi:hypothetical protein